ncbi:hypothetical protein [Kitasatospora sp. NBC_01302]|uniref:hypothetical protein n=1 Tax=Kitasatospora sp. NBC_01302 TaxID=2903575 RepID=UPI002E114849|nr:hypothetical protein OG294_28785 [Kitasatospora sp. NBC_01302]
MIIGILCLVTAAVAGLVHVIDRFTRTGGDLAYAHAKTAARSIAHQVQQDFDRSAAADSASDRTAVAQGLVKSVPQGQQGNGLVFATGSDGATSSVSFAVDAHASSPDTMGAGEAESSIRLCVKLSWNSGADKPSRLSDTPCPADLQPGGKGEPGYVSRLVTLSD